MDTLPSIKPPFARPFPYFNLKTFDDGIISKTKKITINGLTYAFNPTMLAFGKDILVAFRHMPNIKKPWISYIGLILMDWNFNPISEVIFLNLRKNCPEILSHTEDPRLFIHQGHIYLFYNDNLEPAEKPGQRRDMFMVEIFLDDSGFYSGKPILLKHPNNYPTNIQEKNWTPFSADEELLISYTLNPHEVLLPNIRTGECEGIATTSFLLKEAQPEKYNEFHWKNLRGGTTPLLIGDNYLSFFHASTVCYSSVAKFRKAYHYFMGAYTFSIKPPHEILSISPYPIMGKGLLTKSSCKKRVTYPGGFLLDDENIYVIYGKDDKEIWIAILNREKLMNSLVSVAAKR